MSCCRFLFCCFTVDFMHYEDFWCLYFVFRVNAIYALPLQNWPTPAWHAYSLRKWCFLKIDRYQSFTKYTMVSSMWWIHYNKFLLDHVVYINVKQSSICSYLYQFLTFVGYARDEVLGHNCRFLSSADTDFSTLYQVPSFIHFYNFLNFFVI